MITKFRIYEIAYLMMIKSLPFSYRLGNERVRQQQLLDEEEGEGLLSVLYVSPFCFRFALLDQRRLSFNPFSRYTDPSRTKAIFVILRNQLNHITRKYICLYTIMNNR